MNHHPWEKTLGPRGRDLTQETGHVKETTIDMVPDSWFDMVMVSWYHWYWWYHWLLILIPLIPIIYWYWYHWLLVMVPVALRSPFDERKANVFRSYQSNPHPISKQREKKTWKNNSVSKLSQVHFFSAQRWRYFPVSRCLQCIWKRRQNGRTASRCFQWPGDWKKLHLSDQQLKCW